MRDEDGAVALEPPPGESPIVVLVRPQLAKNIGAAARAMANGGLFHLRLVAPREGWPEPGQTNRAWATASVARTGASARVATATMRLAVFLNMIACLVLRF